jgi:hypothetical protein
MESCNARYYSVTLECDCIERFVTKCDCTDCGFLKKTLLAHEDEVHGWTLAAKGIDYGFLKKGRSFLGS